MFSSKLSIRSACASALMLASAACTTGSEFSGPLPTPDGASFVEEVYPMMLRDCAFVACHGASNRFLHIVGPGRARLEPHRTKPGDPATLSEVLHSYDRARSMLATADRREDSLLLGKPLEPSAGGQGHEGIDELGRNVFATANDPAYALLLRWAHSKGAPPTAAEVSAANAAVDPPSEAAP